MYRVLPLKRRIENMINELLPAHKEKMDDVFNDIEENPYHHPTGKITPFKGKRKHEGWHYDLSHSLRVHYVVNETDKTVTITYVGSHT